MLLSQVMYARFAKSMHKVKVTELPPVVINLKIISKTIFINFTILLFYISLSS